MLLIFTTLVAGCTFPDFPVYQPGMEPFSAAGGLPWEHAENLDRVRGFPAHNPQPITPMAANVWPAAPTTAPTMLDMLKERKAAPRPRVVPVRQAGPLPAVISAYACAA